MPEPDIRRLAARHMVAQDSRWAVDVIRSGRKIPPLDSVVSLLLAHHFARIAYEGTLTLKNHDVGIPEFVELLDHKFATITARVRHATKLLDDTKRSFDEVVEQLEGITRDHQAEFLGNAPRLFRWCEKDQGTYALDGTLVAATIPVAYRLALEGVPDGDRLRAIAEEWGGTLAVLNVTALDAQQQQATLDLSDVSRIRNRDVRSERFLADRYEAEFSVGLRMLLLAIETEVNTLRTFVPATQVGHEEAVFRLKAVVTYHALSSLQHVRELHGQQSPGMKSLDDLLGSEAAVWLLSRAGKRVRNRAMHYPIRQELRLDPRLPMFGIVQAVTGRPHEDVSADMDALLAGLADLFSSWRQA